MSRKCRGVCAWSSPKVYASMKAFWHLRTPPSCHEPFSEWPRHIWQPAYCTTKGMASLPHTGSASFGLPGTHFLA